MYWAVSSIFAKVHSYSKANVYTIYLLHQLSTQCENAVK